MLLNGIDPTYTRWVHHGELSSVQNLEHDLDVVPVEEEPINTRLAQLVQDVVAVAIAMAPENNVGGGGR